MHRECISEYFWRGGLLLIPPPPPASTAANAFILSLLNVAVKHIKLLALAKVLGFLLSLLTPLDHFDISKL